MYNLSKNNYHQKPKPSTIYTPKEVSQFIYGLLTPYFLPEKGKPILDPCSGQGSLLKPWQKAGYSTYGVEIAGDSEDPVVLIQDFLTWDGIDVLNYQVKPQLVLCSPPFNGYGKQLGSEVWLDKIIELFGKETPIVLFAPTKFRIEKKIQHLTDEQIDHNKSKTDFYPPISSIISLPRDIFAEVEFHSEILIFNLKGLQPHYFFHPTSQIEQRTPI